MSRVDEVFEIEDLRVLELVNNPTRLRIFRHLAEPRTVKEVAEAMGVPVTRLYYHVGLLEEVGVIQAVETRKVGAMIEKLYQCVAGTFRPSAKLLEGSNDVGRVAKAAANAVISGARVDAEQGLFHHFEALAEGKERSEQYPGSISRTVRTMTREQARDFVAQLEEFVTEWGRDTDEEDPDDVEEYAFSVVFFPLAESGGGGPR